MQGNSRVHEPIIPHNPPVYYCHKASGSPGALDGDITKPFWRQGEWITDFHDIEGDSLPRPSKQTRAKVLWTEEALYIAAELQDDTIWAHVAERDQVIFSDNDFEVFLAPQDSSHRYYELEMNARNTVWDLYMDRPQRDKCHRVIAWDIHGLETAVQVTGTLNEPGPQNKGWSLEIKLPWFSLRECPVDKCYPEVFAPAIGEVWRMDFSRVEYDVDVVDGQYVKRKDSKTGRELPEHNWLWAPTGVIDAHMPEMWGYLVFTDRGEEHPLPADDAVKWLLRRVYYKEHAHACETCAYSTDAQALLGPEGEGVQIYATPSLFEAIAEWNGQTYHIDQDGYQWIGDRK